MCRQASLHLSDARRRVVDEARPYPALKQLQEMVVSLGELARLR